MKLNKQFTDLEKIKAVLNRKIATAKDWEKELEERAGKC
jgi:hypothetical protein